MLGMAPVGILRDTVLGTEANRPLEGENVVIWYTLNYHHLPRPEDYPVQPVVYAGFHWMPDGFFDENPAMDVPP